MTLPALNLLLLGTLVLGLMHRPASGTSAPGGDRQFPAYAIPVELLAGADYVVRLETIVFTVESPGRATTRTRRVVTILLPAGREAGVVYVHQNKFERIKSLTGLLRDAEGNVIRKLRASEIENRSAIAGSDLYADSRIQVARLYYDAYPYTIEFEHEVEHKGLIHWPGWYLQEAKGAMEAGYLEVSVPAGMDVRSRVQGWSGAPTVAEAGGRKTLRWSAARLPARKAEDLGPSLEEQLPSVRTAPGAFEIDGHSGDLSSWAGFGAWYHALSRGRDGLPAPIAARIREIAGGAGDDREKVQRVYDFLQQTTRYVSVQLGIGGWQPFDAAYVAERGYGDCKALTNYLMALLKETGVQAYPALIRAGYGEPDVQADFPENRFNHVILFVPLAADTVWLEATSQTVPFGYLGPYTEDRHALVVTPEGGRLVRTPKPGPADNQQARRATVALGETGDARATVETRYTGNQQGHVRDALAQRSPRDREEWVRNMVDIGNFRLLKADFSQVERKEPALTLPLELELPKYASRTGPRLFVRLNLMERWTSIPAEIDARTQPVRLPYAYLDTDTITYRIPAGFRVEAQPDPVAVETPFGSYHAAVEVLADGSIRYSRRLELREHRLPAEAYGAYRAFVLQIVQADRAQIVLVKTS